MPHWRDTLKRKHFTRNHSAKKIQRAFRARKNQSNMVKKTLYKLEPFKYDAFSSTTAVPNSWTLVNNITNISYDPNATTSDGARSTTKILVKHLGIRGTISVASGDGTNSIRLALVRGRRAGALNLADVGYGTATDLNAQFNQKFVDVIWDKTFQVQETLVGAVFPPYKYLDINTSINKTCKFEEQSSAGQIQPYNNTAYYLIACSDSGVAPNPSIRINLRLSYKQLD